MHPDPAPRRHDRVWLDRGFEAALRAPLAAPLRAEVAAWIARGGPLVAARRDPAAPEALALGLALGPGRARRVAVRVDPSAAVRVAPPLALATALASAPPAWRGPLAALDAEARGAGTALRVHGSLAWQHLSGARHVRPGSDVDLLLRPRDAAELEGVLALLGARAGWDGPRLDGEVILPGEAAVAWRELAFGADRVLVKSGEGVALVPRRVALAPLVLGGHALAALREELELAPKPGLVSPGDPGAHSDMDAATFAASLRALRGYFPAIAGAAASGASEGALRALGVEAEARMLRATGGVNTHRGAIFALGILVAAAARLVAEGGAPGPARLREAARRLAGPALLREEGGESHGAVVRRRLGAGGARAEAAAGFPHVFEVALPALEEALRRGAPRRAAAVQALLASVAALPDTNLLWRGGPEGLAFARRGASGFLAGGGVHRAGWEGRVRALHAAFIARRLSPGGSADVLAAALLVHRLASAGAGAAGERAA